MSECNHDCSHCQSDCASRTASQSLVEKPNALSSVKKVIGIVSGKGGVGKSLVTSMLAVLLNRTIPSYEVGKAVLDELMEANRQWWPELK